jgi:hypothetical protein
MRKWTVWALACGLVACATPAPSSSGEETAPPPPKPSAGPSAVPSASSRATPPATSAAPSEAAPVDAGSGIACTFELKVPADDITRVPSPVLAHAIIPTLDSVHMKAKVVKGDGGLNVVRDCHGGAAPATWEEADSTKKPLAEGTIRVLGRKSFPDGREAVWIATAKELGACVAEDGYGFFAIVKADGPRVNVLGVSPWHPSCGPKRQFRAEKLGDETVYVETEKEGTGAGFDGWENVWTLHSGELRLAGRYDTLQTGAAESGGAVGDDGLYPPSFTGTAKFVGSEIVVKGEITFMKPTKADTGTGFPFTFAKKSTWTKRYELKDGVLAEKQAEKKALKTPPPKPH